jgi:hypothetical protein
MYEVGTALGPSRFSVVWGWRSARTQDLAGNMTSGRCFRQMSSQFNNLYRKRHQPALKLIGSSLRHSILLTYSNCIPLILIQKKSQMTNSFWIYNLPNTGKNY